MAYAINPVDGDYQLAYVPSTGWPATFRYALLSAWVEFKNDQSGWQMLATGYNVVADANRGIIVWATWPGDTPPRVLNVMVGDGNSYAGNRNFGFVGFDMTALVAGVYYNVLISIDSIAQVIQCYVNDAPLSIIPTPVWFASTNIAEPVSAADGSGNGAIDILARNNFVGTNPCVADAFWAAPAAFFDLSVTANRRKFINADLTPVYLGANGELPLGTTPQEYATVPPSGLASAFLVNRGITGGTFVNSGAGVLCNPPVPRSITLADAWFSNTDGAVDLTSVANRRKFISDIGGAQNLGPDGSTPFGVAPMAFLTRTSTPASFASNKGRGGLFAISGGSLAAGLTAPQGTSVTVTRGGTSVAGRGVLGDYRNGNLYAFNPATYLDNGSQRKWVRRWRAVPGASVKATRFDYLAIDMQTGGGVPAAPLYALNLPFGGQSFSGGTGYAVNDIIALHNNDGTQVIRAVLGITSVSSTGAVTGWNLNTVGNYSGRPTGFTQSSSNGAGTGFTLTITNPDVAFAEVATESPRVMLRWSDDGGHSWSNERIKGIGRAGQTAVTVKFNRLGTTARFGGADRIFELSSTDPFQVAVIDAEVDGS